MRCSRAGREFQKWETTLKYSVRNEARLAGLGAIIVAYRGTL
jgi:hypothetical protein